VTLYAPQIGSTIVSIGCIASTGYSVSFENGSCNIQKEQNSKIVGSIPANGNSLYKVEHILTAGAVTEQVNIHTLHRRLGHVSLDSIWKLVCNNAVAGLQIIDDPSPFFCDSCQYAKATRKAICKERSTPQVSAFGDEVHTDVWGGPTTPTSLGGCKYYVSFTDDYSRYTWLTLLRTKDEALEAYRAFAAWAKTQHGATIKCLCSDRGGEYTGKEFSKFLQEEGSEQCLTTHDTPQHNGVSEALNRCLLECICAMMHATGLLKNLWGEAINHAVWLKNRASTRALGNVTLYERLYGEKPNLGGVPEWGQCIWVHDDMGSKLDVRANEARWVGFDSGSPHAHRVYWMGKNSISVERNIKFVPITVTVFTPPPSYDASITPTVTQPTASTTIPPITPSTMMPPWMAPITITPRPTFMRRAQVGTQTPALSSMLPPTTPPQPISQAASDEDVADNEKEEAKMPGYTPQAPKKKKKKTAEPSQPMHKSQRIPKLSDYMKRLETGEGTTGEEFDTVDTVFSVEFKGIIAAAIHKADGDPKTLSDAQMRSDWPLWKAAMDRKLTTLEQAGTWETVPRPPNMNIVGSKWVFRIKHKANGTIEKYKV
jgi:transposase InsO family protein